MTPSKPERGAAGEMRLGPVKVDFDGGVFEPRIEEVPIEDAHLRSSWGERLYRVLLAAKNPPAQGVWTVRISS
jgi:hypothetical protein